MFKLKTEEGPWYGIQKTRRSCSDPFGRVVLPEREDHKDIRSPRDFDSDIDDQLAYSSACESDAKQIPKWPKFEQDVGLLGCL